MEPNKLKLYAVGSTEISQFILPFPPTGPKERPSHSRRPFLLSEQANFQLVDQDNEDDDDPKITLVPNPLLKESIKQVVCGGGHTLLLTEKRQVYSFGSNDEGALGRKGYQTVPILVPLEYEVDSITAGDCHSTFASMQRNLIYFCGVYRGIVKGQIGDKVQIPIEIYLSDIDNRHKLERLIKVVSGYNHTMVLVDQTVYIRGDFEYFALGRRLSERRKDQIKPTEWMAIGLKKVVDIWTGGMHCFAKVQKNKKQQLYGWGNNSFGQLGLGRKGVQTTPEYISEFSDMNITKIVGGQHHTIFLNSQGEVYSCGKNDVGQLGLGQNYGQDDEDREEADKLLSYVPTPTKIQELQNVVDIISGPHFSYAISSVNGDKERSLYSWGMPDNFILLNGSDKVEKFTPYNVLAKIINHEKIVDFSAGGLHLMYLAENNPNPPPPEPPVIKNPPQKTEVPSAPQPQPPAPPTPVTSSLPAPPKVDRKSSHASNNSQKKRKNNYQHNQHIPHSLHHQQLTQQQITLSSQKLSKNLQKINTQLLSNENLTKKKIVNSNKVQNQNIGSVIRVEKQSVQQINVKFSTISINNQI